ncbi:MAG: hypothetical protein OXG60_07165 [Chloroflexi bacterium]|nr:hypothetical protein [Chloroflexota bacterium]
MATITANTRGKIQQARKRLKKNVAVLKGARSLSASQRETSLTRVLIDLHHIALWRLGRLSEVE